MVRLARILILVLCASLIGRAQEAQKLEELLEFKMIQVKLSLSLVPQVDPMIKSVADVRATLLSQLGFKIPAVRFTDDRELKPGEYVVLVRESTVARGQFTDLPSWKRDFTRLMSRHAAELLHRELVYLLLAEQKSDLSASRVHPVLLNLLEEEVSIADLDPILRVIAANPALHPDAISEEARRRLNVSAPYLSQGTLTVATVDPELERRIEQATVRDKAGRVSVVGLDPTSIQGIQPDAVVLASDSIRMSLHRLLPGVIVLARSEVPAQIELKILGSLK